MARPTKYKTEMCAEVVSFMRKGYSKSVVSAKLGICPDTFSVWQKDNAEFSAAVKEGELLSQLFWEKAGIDGMMGEITGFNATTWIFNMKNRHGWRDKVEVDNTSSDGSMSPAKGLDASRLSIGALEEILLASSDTESN